MRFGEPGSDRSDDDRLSRMLSNRTSRLTADRVGEAGTLNPAGIGKQEIDTMLSRIGAAISVLSVVTGGLVLSTPAQAHDVRVGVMTCDMAGGFGYVLGSSRDLQCTFSPASGPAEHYAGTISKFGVDIGAKRSHGLDGRRPDRCLNARVADRHLWRCYRKRYRRRRRRCQHAGWWLQRYDLPSTGQHRRRHRAQCRRWFRIDEPDFSAELDSWKAGAAR